jgi:hypothetical protein
MEKKSVLVSFIILLLVALGGSAAGIYYYAKYTHTLKKVADPKLEAKELVQKLGKLIELPEEEPTVATVTNAEQIKSQPFFAKAKNGDRVILYTNGRMAILYDDKANKIVNVGVINVSNDATASGTQQIPGTSTNEGGDQQPGLSQ